MLWSGRRWVFVGVLVVVVVGSLLSSTWVRGPSSVRTSPPPPVLPAPAGGAHFTGSLGSTTATTGGESPGYPTARFGQGLAYDTEDGYAIMPGPVSGTTWKYEDGLWTLFGPAQAPSLRSYYCLAYDPAAGAVVLFGGGAGGLGYKSGIGFAVTASNQTWTFSNGQWQNVTDSVGSPPALKYPACAYDPMFDGGAIIVMGGANSSYEADGTWLMNDTNATWAFVRNAATGNFDWVHLTPRQSPSARFGADMAFDSNANELVLYGGAQNGTSTANGSCAPATCPHFHDTWSFAGSLSSNTWTLLSNGASSSPPGSVLTDMAYDATDGYIIDFGGQGNGYKSLNATLNETWAFDGSTWKNITPAISPGTRFGAAIAFDNATGHVLMFSGLSGTVENSPLCDDFWEFATGRWTPLSYPIVFNERGLPLGDSWGVTMNDSRLNSIVSLTNTSVTQDRPNGTFSFVIDFPAGYGPTTNASGSFTVAGTATTVRVDFGAAYPVTFSESGLPGETNWTVTVTNTTSLASTTLSSTTSKVTFSEVNGSYAYGIGLVPGYHTKGSGSFTLSGKAVRVHLVFTLTRYTVRFAETGLTLAWKTSWCATFNATERCSTSSSISFDGLPNGTYSYSIEHLQNYSLGVPYSGSVTVSGGGPGTVSNTVKVPWKLVTYKVTFTETGLPRGTNWSVTLDGKTITSTSTKITFSISNGTYNFSASSVGYLATPSSGSVIVDGSNVTQHVSFTDPSPPPQGPMAVWE